ncbi:MAG: hypothetical protein LBU21_08295 [Treponema sp.]|jgi:hypothetical protein|nr:hypothetical protein [Treponema sp.]
MGVTDGVAQKNAERMLFMVFPEEPGLLVIADPVVSSEDPQENSPTE